MTTIFNKIKSFAMILMVLSFTIGITLNACTSNKKTENTENVEAASESEEHPAGDEEHPTSGEEHPTSEEHPSDSTAVEHPK